MSNLLKETKIDFSNFGFYQICLCEESRDFNGLDSLFFQEVTREEKVIIAENFPKYYGIHDDIVKNFMQYLTRSLFPGRLWSNHGMSPNGNKHYSFLGETKEKTTHFDMLIMNYTRLLNINSLSRVDGIITPHDYPIESGSLILKNK